MVLRGKGLDKMDTLGKSDPYVQFSRPSTNPKTKPVPIVKTEIIKSTLDPTWKPITVSVNSLCGGDIENGAILVECFDDDLGKDELIGSFTVSR